jgi:LPXTG-site transpeptidase (sortase) family protein
MKKRGSRNSRLTYGAIAVMNLFVVGMFVAILFPEPAPVSFEPLASAAPKHLIVPASTKINLGIPIRIIVPSVGIDLPVRTGSYDPTTQTWTLDTYSAFYADNSVPANDSNGSTIIYGHAQWGLFAKIPDITNGATAQVYTDSGKVFSYTFASTRKVKQDDTSVFVNSGAPMLTLLTCSGAFDAYRTLVSFNLSGVTNQ